MKFDFNSSTPLRYIEGELKEKFKTGSLDKLKKSQWKEISNAPLSGEFIEKYADKLDWSVLLNSDNIKIDTKWSKKLKENIKENIDNVFENGFNTNFIENWTLDEELIRFYLKKAEEHQTDMSRLWLRLINPAQIHINENILKENIEKIPFVKYISTAIYISPSFFEETILPYVKKNYNQIYFKKLMEKFIVERPFYNFDFIERHIDEISPTSIILSGKTHIIKKAIEKYPEKFSPKHFMSIKIKQFLPVKPDIKDIEENKKFITILKDNHTKIPKSLTNIFYTKKNWIEYLNGLKKEGLNENEVKNRLIDIYTFTVNVLNADEEKIKKVLNSAIKKQKNRIKDI